MKTVIVFLVLLATVFCHPVKRSVSSSESSEEVVRLKADPMLQNAAPTQTMTVGSDESPDSSDEADSASDDSADTDENDTESDESEESTESPTQSPSEPPTEPPVIWETTPEPVTDSGRGDNLGYPSNYKKDIIYVESNSINKGYSPYKYYDMEKAVESMGLVSKKASVYDGKGGNDIEKNLKVYKALQVHEEEEEEEDASTPEVESQGLDPAGGMGEGPAFRQADLEPEAGAGEPAGTEESASAGESDSSSASEEEGEESQSSQSSEETTATPADSSQSSESQESDYTEAPVIVIAK